MNPFATEIAFVGLGSNLQGPARHILQAVDELARLPATRVTGRSRLYRSAPVGKADQPDFVNAVARLETGLTAPVLMRSLLEIEAGHGRERGERNAARTLDLDLLIYGTQVIHLEGLDVPHPRMHERAFVLLPLSDLAPDLVIPNVGALRELLPSVAHQRVEPLDLC